MGARGHEPVRRVEVELPDRDDREARAECAPGDAAVERRERTDVGARVERVSVGRVEDDRVDRAVRKVAADVGPALPAVARLEDVAGLGRCRGIESGVRGVGDPVVARVDRELGHGSLRQLAVVEACPGRGAINLSVGADVDEAVERARVHGLSATHADRGDGAVARAVRRGAGASAGEVGADDVPPNVAGGSGSRVVSAVQAIGPEEELIGVRLVHHERDVEVGPVGQIDPATDELVAEEVAAVGVAVRRDAEIRAVDVARRAKCARVGRGVDEDLATVAAGDVEPGLAVDRLAKGAVVLRAAPESRGGRTDGDLRHGRDGCELADL